MKPSPYRGGGFVIFLQETTIFWGFEAGYAINMVLNDVLHRHQLTTPDQALRDLIDRYFLTPG